MNAYWCSLEERIVGRSYDPPDPGEPNYERMERGEDPDPLTLYARLWLRVHEVLDHGGRPCDCPVEEAEAA